MNGKTLITWIKTFENERPRRRCVWQSPFYWVRNDEISRESDAQTEAVGFSGVTNIQYFLWTLYSFSKCFSLQMKCHTTTKTQIQYLCVLAAKHSFPHVFTPRREKMKTVGNNVNEAVVVSWSVVSQVWPGQNHRPGRFCLGLLNQTSLQHLHILTHTRHGVQSQRRTGAEGGL